MSSNDKRRQGDRDLEYPGEGGQGASANQRPGCEQMTNERPAWAGPWEARQIIPQLLTQTPSTLIHPIIPDGKNK